MGYQDRQYYRDGTGSRGNPLMWLVNGEVSLFTAFGIQVKAHASLLVFMAFVLLFGFGQGSNVQARVQSMTILFAVILLHEFGHCFAARWTGGSAEKILMTPLGGLASAYAQRNPWSQFVTVAGGPLVNVIICLLCGLGLFLTIGYWPLGPWSIQQTLLTPSGWDQFASYLGWFYSVSYVLLLFNMLPVFPLDGGQLLQSILWKPMGYYKSMRLAVNIGIGGAVLMMMVGLATFGTMMGGLFLMLIGLMCLLNCINMRRMLLSEGPWGFSEENSVDYSAAYDNNIGRGKRKSNWQAKRASKRAVQQADVERREQETIDAILAKVSAQGMNSLTWLEKRALKKATERQRLAEEARVKRAYR